VTTFSHPKPDALRDIDARIKSTAFSYRARVRGIFDLVMHKAENVDNATSVNDLVENERFLGGESLLSLTGPIAEYEKELKTLDYARQLVINAWFQEHKAEIPEGREERETWLADMRVAWSIDPPNGHPNA
jgi:hypothetical protein